MKNSPSFRRGEWGPGDNGRVQSHEFRRDLYRGTARDYETYRLPYPAVLIAELAARAGADGSGRLLDLACGTGQLSFVLRGLFAETWAVDQEPDMIRLARQKAAAAGTDDMHFVTSPAEDVVLPAEAFDLVVIGNAFHRLPRPRVARSVWRWLRPGRQLALFWSASPWDGPEPWQKAMSATMARWRARLDDTDRIPPGYEQARRDLPDQEVLRQAGFELADRSQVTVRKDWTSAELAGFVYSTAVLSRAALGPLASAFEDDLRRAVEARAAGSMLRQEVSFVVELARRPG
jgi:ubiquinone/menaquinone biosynthesis C-methylase UbiE